MNEKWFPEYLNISRDLLHVIVILMLAWLLIALSRRLIRMFRIYTSAHSDSAETIKRIETLARVFRYISTVVISLVAGSLP